MSKINFQDWFEELKEHIIRDTEKRVIDEVIEIIDSLTFELSDEYVNGKTKICDSNALKIELKQKYGVKND